MQEISIELLREKKHLISNVKYVDGTLPLHGRQSQDRNRWDLRLPLNKILDFFLLWRRVRDKFYLLWICSLSLVDVWCFSVTKWQGLMLKPDEWRQYVL